LAYEYYWHQHAEEYFIFFSSSSCSMRDFSHTSLVVRYGLCNVITPLYLFLSEGMRPITHKAGEMRKNKINGKGREGGEGKRGK